MPSPPTPLPALRRSGGEGLGAAIAVPYGRVRLSSPFGTLTVGGEAHPVHCQTASKDSDSVQPDAGTL